MQPIVIWLKSIFFCLIIYHMSNLMYFQGVSLTIDLVAVMCTTRPRGCVMFEVGCQPMFPVQSWSSSIFALRCVKLAWSMMSSIRGDENQESRSRKKGIRLTCVQRHASKTGSCKRSQRHLHKFMSKLIESHVSQFCVWLLIFNMILYFTVSDLMFCDLILSFYYRWRV